LEGSLFRRSRYSSRTEKGGAESVLREPAEGQEFGGKSGNVEALLDNVGSSVVSDEGERSFAGDADLGSVGQLDAMIDDNFVVAKDVGGRNHRGGASTVEDPSRIVVGLNNPGGEVGQWEGHEARVNDLGCHGGWSLLLTDEGTGLPLSLLLPLFGKGWHGGLLEAVVLGVSAEVSGLLELVLAEKTRVGVRLTVPLLLPLVTK